MLLLLLMLMMMMPLICGRKGNTGNGVSKDFGRNEKSVLLLLLLYVCK